MFMYKLVLNLFLFILVLDVCLSAKTDKTLVDKAVGKDVVDAVNILVQSSGIFKTNNGFLVRMAYVATQFGQDSDTFTTKANMWALTQAVFDKTKDAKTYPILTAIYTNINQKFKIDWSGIKFSDLSQPLIGGLAVSIIMAINDPVPIYLEEQGNYYNKYFSPSTTGQQFYDKVKDMEKLGTCRGRMDLTILLDASGSIGKDNFTVAQNFVAQLVSTFSLDNVNLGLIVFSETSDVTFPLNNNLTLAEMTSKIKNINYFGGGTNTTGAIQTAQDILLKTSHQEGRPRIMVIFTDGVPNNQTSTVEAANVAIKSNITLFAVGIGSGINQIQLSQMVLNQPNHVFSLSSYKSLSESFDMINTETCKIGQLPVIGKKIEDTLNKNEKRYFCYDLPQIGITVTIDVKVGKTESYYSYTQQNPSSALNDGQINGKTFIPALKTGPGFRAKRDTTTIRICVTVEGLEIHNNFTIDSQEGNHDVIATTEDTGDRLINIKAHALAIAKESIKMPNMNQMSNHVCNAMSETYSKYGWICVVGQNYSLSERLADLQLFQFNFIVDTTHFHFLIDIP